MSLVRRGQVVFHPVGRSRLRNDDRRQSSIAVEYDLGQVFLFALVDSYGQEVIEDEYVNVLESAHFSYITIICRREGR